MSTINEALKKAQDKKDTRYLIYGSILAAGKRKKSLPQKRYLPWLIIPALVIILTLTSDAWLDRKNVISPDVKENDAQTEQRTETPPARFDENVTRLYDRAMSFHRQGQLTLAKRFYLEVLRIDPGHVKTINNLGVICLVEKNVEEAESFFMRALDISPWYVDAHYNLACLYSLRGEVSQGIAKLKKAIQLDQTAREWARMDGDLDGLRASPEFQALLDR